MVHLGVLAGFSTAVLALGTWEAYWHKRALQTIPLRIHVNGTRGKTSVTQAITTLFRELGQKTVGKCTGTAPMLIDETGQERNFPRRGRARIQEQVRFLRYAARIKADVAVVECMALDPTLQWISEHRLIRSHIGVITNVRRDHFEEMGHDVSTIARSLANTIPKHGILIVNNSPHVPLFIRVAETLGTRVVIAEKGPVALSAVNDVAKTTPPWHSHGYTRKLFMENEAIARTVARVAGFSKERIAQAAKKLKLPTMHWSPLSGIDHRGDMLVHAWAMNDTDSFRDFWQSLRQSYGEQTQPRAAPQRMFIPLYNHRQDRPLRTLAFAALFASWPYIPYIFITGDHGAEQLFRRAGIPQKRLVRLPTPCTHDHIVQMTSRYPFPVIVVGCGNAHGVALHNTIARSSA